jgi:hypothetical protein
VSRTCTMKEAVVWGTRVALAAYIPESSTSRGQDTGRSGYHQAVITLKSRFTGVMTCGLV